MTGAYTFGDSDLAALRLALVAEAFEPSSRRLLASAVPPGADTAVDLGCGPGYTTRLLAATCRPRRTIGLDGSAAFVRAATELTDDPTVTFAVHDVTTVPFPTGPADVVYARLLLAHLPDPVAVAQRWQAQLRPGGVLVLDEVEAMEPPPGVLRDYADLVVALIAAEGADMFAGPLLAGLGGHCVDVPIPAPLAARMFSMNLAVWRQAALTQGLADTPTLTRMSAALSALATGAATAPHVHWTFRHLTLGSI